LQKPKLNILPPLKDTIETFVEMETINYEYGSSVDEYGDREVIDVSRTYTMSVSVPEITFLDWVLTLCRLKDEGVATSHIYSQQIMPYAPQHISFWGYYNDVRGNLLSNGTTYRDVDKVRMYIYLIKEFNYFAVLRIHSHQDIVTYSINESE
jgi:hypothetical protein